MPLFSYSFKCPKCSADSSLNILLTQALPTLNTQCGNCCYPLTLNTTKNTAEIRVEPIKKKAFLIHSSKPEEENLLLWFRTLTQIYGVNTFIIEEDSRSEVDWLQKSLDGISSADFVVAFLTKRYQFMNEKGQVAGWKAPDKCYDELAMSFALHRDILALVEKEVDLGRVLETRAWCYRFEREPQFKPNAKFFNRLDRYLGN